MKAPNWIRVSGTDANMFVRWFWTLPEAWSPYRYENWQQEYEAIVDTYPELWAKFKTLQRLDAVVTDKTDDFDDNTQWEIPKQSKRE